jgi:PAS domain S-box-containing protein
MESGDTLSAVDIAESGDVSALTKSLSSFDPANPVLQQILNTIPAAIFTTDLFGRITYFNKACVPLSGQEPLLGSDEWCAAFRLFHADGRPLRHDQHPSYLPLEGRQTVHRCDVVCENFDGSQIWFELFSSCLEDRHHRVVGVINMLVDITERRREERATEQQRDELSDFFENASVGIHWVGADGTILRVNKAELQLLGYSPDEYVGHHISEFHADQAVVADILDRLHGGEILQDCEARLKCKDGTLKIVMINSSVLWHGDRFIHTRCFTRDVTEQKHAESALRESRQQLNAELALTHKLHEVSLQSVRDGGVLAVHERILECASEIMNADMACIHLVDEAKGALPLLASRGVFSEFVRSIDHSDTEAASCFALARSFRRFTVADVNAGETLTGSLIRPERRQELRAGQSTPLFSRSGHLVGLLSTYWRGTYLPEDQELRLLDILARQASDLIERNAAELRLQAIFNGTYEFIGLLSPSGHVLEANQAALNWIDAKRDAVIGLPFAETPWWTHTPGASEELRSDLEQASKGQFVRREVNLRSLRGETVTFDFSLHPIRDESGKVIFLVPEGRNISERKKAENEIRTRYADGLKLTEVSRALVGAITREEVTRIVCRAARDLVRADAATFILREAQRVRYVEEDSIAPLWKGHDFSIEACISGWAMLNSEIAIVRDIYEDPRIPHSAYRPTFVKSLVMTPVGPGTPVASIGVYWAEHHEASDYEIELLRALAGVADLALTGSRAFEESLRARRQAEEANRLKDEFLATLSHELRNPLNSVVGYSELLLRRPEVKHTPPLAKSVAVIHRNARAQAQLINDLLDLSRLHTGKLTLEFSHTSLNLVTESAIESVAKEFAEREVGLTTELPTEEITANGDSLRLQQVIWNLLSNALKFTPSGGNVLVRLKSSGSWAELSVEDSGVGIAPDFLPSVFEMFRQADGRTTRSHGGMGIGLALVKQLTELHRGTVGAFSGGPGQGARFTITLPIISTSKAEQPGESPNSSESLCGVRILIVEDSIDSLGMLSALFSHTGAEVYEASNGELGLQLAMTTRFDVVISDIGMPGMDGYEFLTRLRALDPTYASVPAVALTGFGREGDIEKANQVGFSQHLTKPVDFEKLLHTVAHLCRPLVSPT